MYEGNLIGRWELNDWEGEFEPSREQLHLARQQEWTERVLAEGPRKHTIEPDEMARYLTPWRLSKAVGKLLEADKGITWASSVLALCAAEGNEGSVLADMGFLNVTVSDLSEAICGVAVRRDPV